MKVCIMTLQGNFNYGNRLQNYALQEILKKIGYDVYSYPTNDTNALNKFKNVIFDYGKDGRSIKKFSDFKRDRHFDIFTRNYIKLSKLNDADYYIVGSDQVWNPSFWGDIKNNKNIDYYLLKNIDPKKRISYAASFGIDKLPNKWEQVFQEELTKFKNISVREETGVNIVSNLTNRKSNLVLDPTMLLGKEEWEQIIVQPNKSKYILLYYLGEVSEELQFYINSIEAKYELEVINIMDKKNKYYSSGPAEFIGLIRDASLVLTDSFHATVFSILFSTPFLAFDRKQKNYNKMGSRIFTLLNTFSFEERFNNLNIDNPLQCDFNRVNKKLEIERKKSIEYLVNALKNEVSK